MREKYANGSQYDTVLDLKAGFIAAAKNITSNTIRAILEGMPRRAMVVLIIREGYTK